MTEEIEKLVNGINACISDRTRMLAEKNEMKKMCAETIRKNYGEIFLPKVEELKEIISIMYKNAVYVKKRVDSEFQSGENTVMQVRSDGDTYEYTYQGYDKCIGWLHGNTDLLKKFQAEDDILRFETDKYRLLMDFFGTEEKTINAVKFMQSITVSVLQSMSERISEFNSELAEQLDKLKNAVSNKSTVEHKDDGTIEISIGGKTYIGTIKEN